MKGSKIENTLPILHKRKALDSRQVKFAGVDYYVEAVEIFLPVNNWQFSVQTFVQKPGIAMHEPVVVLIKLWAKKPVSSLVARPRGKELNKHV